MTTSPHQIPDETWNDLATLYLAGEASPATRRLIEERLSQDSAFANKLSSASMPNPLEAAGPEQPPSRDSALKTLRQTRQYLFLRSQFMGLAIACSLAPFTFVFRGGELTFFLWRDIPGAAYAFIGVALASWSACYVMHRQVRKVFR